MGFPVLPLAKLYTISVLNEYWNQSAVRSKAVDSVLFNVCVGSVLVFVSVSITLCPF